MERPTSPPDPAPSDGVVTLRSWTEDDVAALVRLCNGDEELARWIDRLPQPFTEDDAREYVDTAAKGWRGEGLHSPLAIVSAKQADVLGSCTVFWHNPEHGVAEIGFWTGREARGHGVATRTVRLLAAWILGDLAYERLELQADTRNQPSQRVAEKTGFTFEGVIRSARTDLRDGERVDQALYSLLRGELRR